MKKLTLLFASVCLYAASAFAGAGFGHESGNTVGHLYLKVNGTDKSMQLEKSSTPALDLGTVASLELNSFYAYTGKDENGNVCSIVMHYTFDYYVNQDSLTAKWDSNKDGNDKQQVWKYGTATDLIKGLAKGDYTMKFWLEGVGNTTSNDGCNKGAFAANNDGADYMITFTVGDAPIVTKTYYIAGNKELVGQDWKSDGVALLNDTIVLKDVPAGTHAFKITDGKYNSGEDTGHELTTIDYDCTSEGVDYDKDGNISFTTEKVQDITIALKDGKICVTVDAKAAEKVVVKLLKPEAWTEVAVYSYSPDKFGSWPGTKLTVDADGWASVEVPVGTVNLIFNNNIEKQEDGGEQTVDVAVVSEAVCYQTGDKQDGKYTLLINKECKAGGAIISTEGFSLLVNADKVQLVKNGETEYKTMRLELKVGDVLKPYDNKGATEFKLKNLEQEQDLDAFTLDTETGAVTCTKAGTYDIYLKLAADNDGLYIGKSEEIKEGVNIRLKAPAADWGDTVSAYFFYDGIEAQMIKMTFVGGNELTDQDDWFEVKTPQTPVNVIFLKGTGWVEKPADPTEDSEKVRMALQTTTYKVTEAMCFALGEPDPTYPEGDDWGKRELTETNCEVEIVATGYQMVVGDQTTDMLQNPLNQYEYTLQDVELAANANLIFIALPLNDTVVIAGLEAGTDEAIEVAQDGKSLLCKTEGKYDFTLYPQKDNNKVLVVKHIDETALQTTEGMMFTIIGGKIMADHELQIFDILGSDVTYMNGNLKGMYIVRYQSNSYKVLIP